MSESTPLNDKSFSITAKEGVYILSLSIALCGQWFSVQSRLKELELKQTSDMALIRLEMQLIKQQLQQLQDIKK